MEFGNAYLASDGAADALQPFAESLADELDESVSVAVPDGRDGVRFVSQVIRRRAMSPVFRVGDMLPADRCAPGALFASGEREWALDDQGVERGLIAVSVPIRNRDGRPVGRSTSPPTPVTARPMSHAPRCCPRSRRQRSGSRPSCTSPSSAGHCGCPESRPHAAVGPAAP